MHIPLKDWIGILKFKITSTQNELNSRYSIIFSFGIMFILSITTFILHYPWTYIPNFVIGVLSIGVAFPISITALWIQYKKIRDLKSKLTNYSKLLDLIISGKINKSSIVMKKYFK